MRTGMAQQIRDALANGEAMTMEELVDAYGWDKKERNTAYTTCGNLKRDGFLKSVIIDGKAGYQLLKPGEPKQPLNPATPRRPALGKNEKSIVAGQVLDMKAAARSNYVSKKRSAHGNRFVDKDAISTPARKTDKHTILDSELNPVAVDQRALDDFVAQRMVVARFVPSQPGVQLLRHRNGDVTIEVTGEQLASSVQLPCKFIDETIKALSLFQKGAHP